MLECHPYKNRIGAEVTGVDLCQPLGGDEFSALNQALLDYEILFFRDQGLEPAQHAALARRFGEPQLHEAYPHIQGYPEITILENDKDNPSLIEKWHTDMTFRACPPLGSILHGVVIPAQGGDTLFASASAAFDDLSDTMQSFLSGLTAIHDFRHGFKESLAAPGGEERLADMVAANPPVEHPVVRVHPESGKRCLYVNSLFTVCIKGMKPRESETLLRFLYEHLASEAYQCRFRWQTNSVAFWDNRIVQHRPDSDYWPRHRRMQRITIDDGERPYGPALS